MIKAQVVSARDAVSQTKGHVLLVNPPVFDRRYPWVKWNQPLDLLKLGTLLKRTQDCDVKLFDFMLPTPKGIVPRRHARIQDDLSTRRSILWHFGRSWEDFDAYLDQLTRSKWIPSTVWITTLTSFWWQPVALVADRIKNKLKRPAVIVYGNYPCLEREHASQFCPNVDIVVTDSAALGRLPADFTLYGKHNVRFCGLDLRNPEVMQEIDSALQNNTRHFAFFNDNIFADFDTRLKPVLEETVSRKLNLQFHGICGVETRDFPIDHLQLLADAHFNELHFELALNKDGLVDERLYRAAMEACEEVDFVSRRGGGWDARNHRYLSGFLWIGKPHDELEKLTWNALKLLQLVGMVIPKPFSPTPGSDDYSLLRSQVDWLEPEDISPHRLPFAGWNGIDSRDYKDFYRMTAFLNYKVRSQTFDFVGDTYLAEVIRQSLEGRRWDI